MDRRAEPDPTPGRRPHRHRRVCGPPWRPDTPTDGVERRGRPRRGRPGDGGGERGRQPGRVRRGDPSHLRIPVAVAPAIIYFAAPLPYIFSYHSMTSESGIWNDSSVTRTSFSSANVFTIDRARGSPAYSVTARWAFRRFARNAATTSGPRNTRYA